MLSRLVALLALAVESVLSALFGAASVSTTAERDVAVAVGEVCDLVTVEALAARHADVRQFVVMATNDFDAVSGTVEVAVRLNDGSWACRQGAQDAMFGRNGTRPLLDRRSGDGTTPAGVFPLGEVTAWDGETFSMFGNDPDPGVQVAYRSVHPNDCWGATANTPSYQHVVNQPGCSNPDEWLQAFGGAYAHAAVIGANLDPISGDGPGETPYAAAIFLHRTSYTSTGASKPTSGCVSLGIDDLIDTVRGIDPDLNPHFAIGPTEWLRSTA